MDKKINRYYITNTLVQARDPIKLANSEKLELSPRIRNALWNHVTTTEQDHTIKETKTWIMRLRHANEAPIAKRNGLISFWIDGKPANEVHNT